MSELPDDLRRRCRGDFPGETCFEALRLLEALALSPRVLRSVVFLASGDFEALQRYARSAERDWRDVVFWAEYEDHDAEEPRQVRSMAEPFAEREA